MAVAIITGSAGLIGSEAVRHFAGLGMSVVGIDNDMRAKFFGADASTAWNLKQLVSEVPGYVHHDFDIRDRGAVERLFTHYGSTIELVIHAAAQPSHDWAASDPHVDFEVNATGTLNLLEACRSSSPEAAFIFTSTNKVYGDTPNRLPLRELADRWEIEEDHAYYEGIPEDMSIDQSKHSLFGSSKVAADVMVQEYGRYFGMNTVSFRGGCLTGPGHSGTQLHGFLAYLMKCTVTGAPYTIFGYEGKQVRDNIHSADLISAFDAYRQQPRPGEVYNIGGGRQSNCSMREGIELCQEIAGRELSYEYSAEPRIGDHIWYISDLAKFKGHFPQWDIRYSVPEILQEIYENNLARWAVTA